jgi:hypothetical protein
MIYNSLFTAISQAYPQLIRRIHEFYNNRRNRNIP